MVLSDVRVEFSRFCLVYICALKVFFLSISDCPEIDSTRWPCLSSERQRCEGREFSSSLSTGRAALGLRGRETIQIVGFCKPVLLFNIIYIMRSIDVAAKL